MTRAGAALVRTITSLCIKQNKMIVVVVVVVVV